MSPRAGLVLMVALSLALTWWWGDRQYKKGFKDAGGVVA